MAFSLDTVAVALHTHIELILFYYTTGYLDTAHNSPNQYLEYTFS